MFTFDGIREQAPSTPLVLAEPATGSLHADTCFPTVDTARATPPNVIQRLGMRHSSLIWNICYTRDARRRTIRRLITPPQCGQLIVTVKT